MAPYAKTRRSKTFTASNVTEGAVPGAGHWLMEEQREATVKLVRAFLDAGQ
jgi:pimeloyl-ACP methyl ester carboxylesterase